MIPNSTSRAVAPDTTVLVFFAHYQEISMKSYLLKNEEVLATYEKTGL